MNSLISLVILIFSAIVHEVSHGLVAEKLGDSTARDEGRITLNPIPHIDPFGSILLPFLLISIGSPIIIGSAKPVPVNFSRLRNPQLGMALVSLAGPLSNLALAVLFVLPIKLGLINEVSGPILIQAIVINLVLAVFNLLPIPPLDGSKIIASFAPRRWVNFILDNERFGFIIIVVFLMLGLLSKILLPVIYAFFNLFNLGVF